jgi:hypothetical protein
MSGSELVQVPIEAARSGKVFKVQIGGERIEVHRELARRRMRKNRRWF